MPEVTLGMSGRTTRSDRTGRFLLVVDGLETGGQTLVIDARTANQAKRTYGYYEVRTRVQAGATNVLPFTIWSPLLDTAHQVTIASPTTSETVITTPLMPGFELHLPAGTVIRDKAGQVARTISVTPIPLDRTPFPLPSDATFTTPRRQIIDFHSRQIDYAGVSLEHRNGVRRTLTHRAHCTICRKFGSLSPILHSYRVRHIKWLVGLEALNEQSTAFERLGVR